MFPTKTRPSSGSASPYPILGDSGGLNTFESAFAFKLECALTALVQAEEENAKAGKGREDMMKLKSEQQLFFDAWGTPTGWADDPYSTNSSVASTPDYPASVGSVQSTCRTIDSDFIAPSTRASTFSLIHDDDDHTLSQDLKRKVDALDDHSNTSSQLLKIKANGIDESRPVKRARSVSFPPLPTLSRIVSEPTPPSTPPSREDTVAVSTGISSKDLAEAMSKASHRRYLGGGCAVQHRSSMSSPIGHHERLQNLPP